MSIQNRSAGQMAKILVNDSNLMSRLKTEPNPEQILIEVAKRAEAETWTGDKTLYRIAICVLGILAISAAGGSIWLAILGENMPEVLVSLGSAAVGALVGLFAPTPTSK